MKRLTRCRSIARAMTGLLAMAFILANTARAQTPYRSQAGDMLLMESGAATKVEEKVRSQALGPVIEVFVKKGDRVIKDQILGHIELDAVKLQLDLARQTLENKADLKAAKSQHDASVATLEETKRAVRRNNAERDRLDWAAAMESMYRAKHEAQQEAKKNQAIQFEHWKRQYDKCFFRAPVDGTVTEVLIEPGANVNMATHVFTISNESALAVPVTVPASLAETALTEGTLPLRSEDGRSVLRALVDSVKDDPRRAGTKIVKLLIDTADLPASTRERLTGMKFDVLLPQIAHRK